MSFLARAQRMNWNTVGKIFNILEKVPTENNLCDTSGEFNIDRSGIQIHNKPDLVIRENRSNNVHV
jgi:hypothetical protein